VNGIRQTLFHFNARPFLIFLGRSTQQCRRNVARVGFFDSCRSTGAFRASEEEEERITPHVGACSDAVEIFLRHASSLFCCSSSSLVGRHVLLPRGRHKLPDVSAAAPIPD
jgi:hypothetical protein